MKLEEINNKTNEAFSFLVAALESGESEVLTQYLNAMARFHTYSFGNIMLIARQKPTATRVAGIRTWNSLGRFVKRGEKGILILAPMVGRKKPTDEIATEVESENSADERKPSAAVRRNTRSRLSARVRVRPHRWSRATHGSTEAAGRG